MKIEQGNNKKSNNYIILNRELREKSAAVSGMPYSLTIDPGGSCPLRCPFCEQTYNDFDLSREFLKFSDFKKIIDYFQDFLLHINLFNWGEPLLNSQISQMIEYASSLKIITAIHTNLNFLTPELAENLVRSNFIETVVSIDGASELSYQKYRKNGSFKTAYGNLKLLCQKKKDLGAKDANITWKFLVFRHNEGEIEKAQQMANDMGIPVKFSFAVASGDFESTLKKYDSKNFREKFCKDYDCPCHQLWRGPIIQSNGDILPCCLVYQKSIFLEIFLRRILGVYGTVKNTKN